MEIMAVGLCDDRYVSNESEPQDPSINSGISGQEPSGEEVNSGVSADDLSALPPPARAATGVPGAGVVAPGGGAGVPGAGATPAGTTPAGGVRDRNHWLKIGAGALVAVVVLVGAWFVIGGGSSESRDAFVLAELSDGELRAFRLGWTPDAAVTAPQRHRTESVDSIRWFEESSVTDSNYVVVGSKVGFIALTPNRRQLIVADPESRESEVWFEIDEGSMVVEYSSALGAFGATVSLDDRDTCYLVSEGQATRAGRGSCWMTTRDEFFVVDQSGDSTSLSRLRSDLSEVSTLSIDEEFNFRGVSTDGRMIHGVDEDDNAVVLSSTGEVIWQRPDNSLSVTNVWRSADDRTLVLVVDSGTGLAQVNVISSVSGDPTVRSIESGERVQVAVSNDGRRMALRSVTYDRETVGPWGVVDLTKSELAVVDVYDGDLTGIFLSLDGDQLVGWDSDSALVVLGSIGDGLRDVFDLDDDAGFALFAAGVIGHSGDEMLLIDPASGEVSVLAFGVEEIGRPTGPSQEVIVFRNDQDEVVLATVSEGLLVELHVAEQINSVQVVDETVWFSAVRSGSNSPNLYRLPLDGSAIAEQVVSSSILLDAPTPIDFSARASDWREVAVYVDTERRECLAEGLPVITVGGMETLPSVPAAGSEVCLYLPRTRDGDRVSVDITAIGGEDLWLELSLDGRVVASGDDLLDSSGAIIGRQPWLVNERLEEGTYRLRVGEYEQVPVSTPVEVSVVPSGTSDPGGSPSAYSSASGGAGCEQTLSVGDRVAVNTDSFEASICAVPVQSGMTYLTVYNDGSSTGGRAELYVSCDNGASASSDSFGFQTLEFDPGKSPVRCDVEVYTYSGDLDEVDVWFDVDRSAAESREVSVAELVDGCPSYVPDEALPMGPCASGISVLFAQEELEARGYALDADGFHGPESIAALLAFQTDAGIQPSGEINAGTWEALGLAWLSADGSGLGPCAIGTSVGPNLDRFLTSIYSSYFDSHVAVACIQPPAGLWEVSFDSVSDTRITLLDYNFAEVGFNDDYYSLDPAVTFSFDGRPYIVVIDRYGSTSSFNGTIYIY